MSGLESVIYEHGSHVPDTMMLISTYTDNDILAHIPRGEHGKGIYSWRLNGQTGKLSEAPLSVNGITPNPAFILKHPTQDIVYASTECIHSENCGEIVTMSLSPSDGSLTELSRVPAGGRSTCYLNVHKSHSFMTAINYWDAIVSLLPMDKEGNLEAPIDRHIQPEASYVFANNPDRVEHWTHRQRWPHTHCFVTEPYTKEVHLVCDLGKDIMWAYRINDKVGKLQLCGGAQLRLQQGPRHVVFHPTLRTCYVVNELKSTVSVLHYDADNLTSIESTAETEEVVVKDSESDESSFLKFTQMIRTLPEDFESNDHHKSHASEIRIHESGEFLLVANRGHDSIACFKIDTENGTGGLTLLHITPSGGVFPRNFNFDITQRWLVVGNQNSNNLTVFSFGTDGSMKMVDQKHQPSPNFVYPLPVTQKSELSGLSDCERCHLSSSRSDISTSSADSSSADEDDNSV